MRFLVSGPATPGPPAFFNSWSIKGCEDSSSPRTWRCAAWHCATWTAGKQSVQSGQSFAVNVLLNGWPAPVHSSRLLLQLAGAYITDLSLLRHSLLSADAGCLATLYSRLRSSVLLLCLRTLIKLGSFQRGFRLPLGTATLLAGASVSVCPSGLQKLVFCIAHSVSERSWPRGLRGELPRTAVCGRWARAVTGC